jgi:hypothetical protein
MSHNSTKNLVRRVETLECIGRKATPQKRNHLMAMAITAMAAAWTPDEVEQILIDAEQSKLSELPADLRGRWVRCLDGICMQQFGKSFGALLVASSSDNRHRNLSRQDHPAK